MNNRKDFVCRLNDCVCVEKIDRQSLACCYPNFSEQNCHFEKANAKRRLNCICETLTQQTIRLIRSTFCASLKKRDFYHSFQTKCSNIDFEKKLHTFGPY